MRWHLACDENSKSGKKALKALEDAGFEVVSRLFNKSFAPDSEEERSVVCFDDIAKSDGVIVMIPGCEAQLGIGIALNKRVALVGTRTERFHFLPGLELYRTINDFIREEEEQ